MTRGLAGKVAIVSGSGRGIGLATARKLAAEGAMLVVNDIDEALAAEAVRTIEAAGGTATACPGDVTSPDFGERFVAAALERYGDLHMIVNNAGYTLNDEIQDQSDAQFEAMLDVHVTAAFRILRAAAEPIRAAVRRETAHGRRCVRKVVNVSSMAATGGSAGKINYAAAKAAVIGMTLTLAKEWGRYGVCVNAVAFGLIDTRLALPVADPRARFRLGEQDVQVGLDPAVIDSLKATIPLGRLATPEEAAGGIYLLCTPESDYISGQVLLVSGGLV